MESDLRILIASSRGARGGAGRRDDANRIPKLLIRAGPLCDKDQRGLGGKLRLE